MYFHHMAAILFFKVLSIKCKKKKWQPIFFISLWYLEAEYDIKSILTKKKNEITIGPLLIRILVTQAISLCSTTSINSTNEIKDKMVKCGTTKRGSIRQ